MAGLAMQPRCLDTLVLCIVTSLLSVQISANTVNVGGTTGWTDFDITTSTAPNYAAWASEQNLHVGDVIEFTFPAGSHNIYLLPSQTALDQCDFSQATVLDAGNTGSFAWKPTKPGNYYISCNKIIEGLGTHCTAGQKLSVAVAGAAPTASVTPPVLAPVVSPVKAPVATPVPAPAQTPSLVPVPTPLGAPAPAPSGPVPSLSPEPLIAGPPTPPSATPVGSTPGSPADPPNAGVALSATKWCVLFATSALAVWL